ncbi:MAG: cytochrome d ubiquinol oxidase subunit II [Campylobacterota bacterium]|nr:cytochrome d ubiquinol oxidase subunit II [Campylobacterota bacterium]
MFDLFTYQQYWWFLVALLGGLFALMSFVQGGQTLLNTLAKDEDEKSIVIGSLGRKWELTFTTLVMFGGALFAAFPLLYAVSFGGAYFVWMIILFCFIVQAVSYEYRLKPNNFLGQKTYEAFLYINGTLGVTLIGIALGTFFTGGNFVKNEMNLSSWVEPTYGLEAVMNPFNVALGLTMLFLSRTLASLYFINNIEHKAIIGRAKSALKFDGLLFVGFFLLTAVMLLLLSGVEYSAEGFSVVEYKFLHNLLEMPLLIVSLLIGVALLLLSLYITLFKDSDGGIWFGGAGAVIAVTSILSLIGFNNTAIYPSLADLQSSLSIENSSGSLYTLEVMSLVSLAIPAVLTYIYFVWKSMDQEKITADEILSDSHRY